MYQPVSWPYRIGAIPTQADCFQHRSAVDKLNSLILNSGTVVLCQVLTGSGGVGKTQLAAHYARRQWTARTVDLLVWVTANNRTAIVSAYAHAGRQLARADGASAEQAATEFLVWLVTTDRRWLIVLDDLTDPGSLSGLWPPEHTTGRTLVTTRRQDAALSAGTRQLVTVGLFTPDEAASYVSAKLSGCQLYDDPEQVQRLAADLGLLPLALAQATAYMADRRLSCSEYSRRLADRRRTLAELLPEESALPDEQRATVAATWSLSIELADQLAPVGLARPELELASMLDPGGIPMAILTSPSALAYLASRRTLVTEEDGCREANRLVEAEAARESLLCLSRLSLVDIAEQNVRVHSLIQRATRDELGQYPGNKFDSAMKAAAQSLLQVWSAVETDMGGGTLRANAEALHANAGSRLWLADAHPVLFRAGLSLGKAGLVASAVNYWTQLHRAAEVNLGQDHPDTLAIRAFHARAQAFNGDLPGAIIAANKLLAHQIRTLGPDHLDTLATRSDLIYWQGKSGNPDAAARATKEFLDDQIQVMGADHHDTWATRRMLIHWLTMAREYSAVAPELERLLEYQLRELGPDHRDVFRTRFRLAHWWVQMGDRARSMVELNEILADQLQVLGPDDTDTLRTRRNIAHLQAVAHLQVNISGTTGTRTINKKMRKLNRKATEALEAYRSSRLRVGGPESPSIPIIERHLIHVRRSYQGSAVLVFSNLVRDIAQALGPDHRETLAVRGQLAQWVGRYGQPFERVRQLEALLIDVVRILGRDDHAALATLAHLAEARYSAGDLSGALDAEVQLLREQERVLDSDDPHIGMTRKRIARWRAEAC